VRDEPDRVTDPGDDPTSSRAARELWRALRHIRASTTG
jgi:hypothetical protein